MIYKLIYSLIKKSSKQNTYAAIRGETMKGVRIEDNIVEGGRLLEVKKFIGGSIKRNLTRLPSPEKIHWFWDKLLDLTVAVIAGLCLLGLS